MLAEKEISVALKKKIVYLRIDVEKREDLVRFGGVRRLSDHSFFNLTDSK